MGRVYAHFFCKKIGENNPFFVLSEGVELCRWVC
jgi:hypothetical protein